MLLMLCASTALAENEEAETTDSVPGLDLFDEDVEETRNGWPQLYVSADSCTWMQMERMPSGCLEGIM